MSSMVLQGLQSCLEPRLKMVATKSPFVKDSNAENNEIDKGFFCNDNIALADNESDNNSNSSPKKDVVESNGDNMDGWSFIQKLTNKEDEQKPYVHPLYKPSSSQLTNKSLELCTETLGSETGSDIGDDIDINSFSSSSSDSESAKSPTRHQSRLRNTFRCYKKANYGSLPPPLTSISGSNCYTIKPHREGGRLVLKAVLTPSTTCFQAERRDGRLQLRYMIRNNSVSDHSSYCTSDSEQEEEKVEEDYFDDDEEEMNGNNSNVGNGNEKIQRPSRCKEGGNCRVNKGLLIWEPFWVAT